MCVFARTEQIKELTFRDSLAIVINTGNEIERNESSTPHGRSRNRADSYYRMVNDHTREAILIASRVLSFFSLFML